MFLAVTESTFSTGINNKECTVCHSEMYIFFIFEHSWNWDIWTFKWIACQFSWQHFPPLMIHKVIMCPTIDMSYIWWNMILSQISGGLVDTVDPWLVVFLPWLYQGPSMTGQAFSFPSQGCRMAAAAVGVTSPINKCSFLTISKIFQVSLIGQNCHARS